MKETLIKPNTILIGAQKCATTSVYNWIAQHPKVCGPSALKDYPFFVKDSFYEKGLGIFENDYIKAGFNNQKIILQGSVSYIFFKEAIDRIYKFNPAVKLLLVLRNPTDRAISAYKYQLKMKRENLSFPEAIKREPERQEGSLMDKSDLTYVSHSKYGIQVDYLLSKFKREQLHVIFYEDIKNDPKKTLQKTFKFLEIDDRFIPEFKVLNRTGKIKYNFLQNIIYSQNKYKQAFVDKVIDPFMPLSKRLKVKNKFKEWNTIKNEADTDDLNFEKSILRGVFNEDISNLEKQLNVNLEHWKT